MWAWFSLWAEVSADNFLWYGNNMAWSMTKLKKLAFFLTFVWLKASLETLNLKIYKLNKFPLQPNDLKDVTVKEIPK